MNITINNLRKIIQEEINSVLYENEESLKEGNVMDAYRAAQAQVDDQKHQASLAKKHKSWTQAHTDDSGKQFLEEDEELEEEKDDGGKKEHPVKILPADDPAGKLPVVSPGRAQADDAKEAARHRKQRQKVEKGEAHKTYAEGINASSLRQMVEEIMDERLAE